MFRSHRTSSEGHYQHFWKPLLHVWIIKNHNFSITLDGVGNLLYRQIIRIMEKCLQAFICISAFNKNTSYTLNSENKPSCLSSTDKPDYTSNVLNSLHLGVYLEVVSNILFSCVPPILIRRLKVKGTIPIIFLHLHCAFCPNFYNLQFLYHLHMMMSFYFMVQFSLSNKSGRVIMKLKFCVIACSIFEDFTSPLTLWSLVYAFLSLCRTRSIFETHIFKTGLLIWNQTLMKNVEVFGACYQTRVITNCLSKPEGRRRIWKDQSTIAGKCTK
jgi:hypothetical protein